MADAIMQTFSHSKDVIIMGKPKINMIGFRSNRWTVLSEAKKPEGAKQTGKFWNCVCDCGTKRVVYGTTLRSGSSKSCGCLKAERSAASMKAMRLEKSGTLEQRFFSRFRVMDNGCWQWQAHSDKDGYGLLPGDVQNIRAHRFSYEYHVGPIPKGMLICHKCDNPGCVNPKHLFVGNAKDNAQDALKKSRHYIGEKNGRAKLTLENVKQIKKSKLKGAELAITYGVSKSTINKIKKGKTWTRFLLGHTSNAQ